MVFEDKTLDRSLMEWSRKYQNHTAVIDRNFSWSYLQLYEKSLIFAGFFRKKGIRHGDKVIMQMTNTVYFPAVFFALCRIGAVPVLCLPAHKELVIEGICRAVQPSAMIFTRSYLKYQYENMAHTLSEKYNCSDKLIFEDSLSEITEDEERNYLAAEKNITDFPSASETAFLLLSGGTTGIPKLIPRTHNDYLYNARVTSERAELSEKTVMLNILPASHNFALGTPGIIGTFMYGGTVVMQKYPDITEFFCNIETYRVNITSLVPALVNMCIHYRKMFNDDNISSLEYVMVGGAMFHHEDARSLETYLDCTVIQVFGMSEGMTFMTDIDADENIRFNYQGKPSSPYDEYRITDENGNDVPDGQAGEIIVRGLYTIHGYYQNEEANKKSFSSDGYYLTGDKAVREKGNNIRILGRIREQINRAGEKIMPSALEEWICRSETVEQCAVIGVPDKELGSKICVFAVTNQKLTLSELINFLKEQKVSDFYMPDMLRITETLPLTPVGKVDKSELSKMLAKENQS